MKVTILGCGTSTGVPVIGCDCRVCSSTNPKNNRTRSSALLNFLDNDGKNKSILIDTSTDLRHQALREKIPRVDAVLYTHHHADHIHGIDDLRAFNRIQNEETIPCYGAKDTISQIEKYLDYIFKSRGSKNNGWKPNLETKVISVPTEITGLQVIPVEIDHANNSILAYRIGGLAYVTDCSGIPAHSMELLKGVSVMIIGALRKNPHPSHFSIGQAISAAFEAGAKRTILTHLGHAIDYAELSAELPCNVEVAFDGMQIEI